MKTTTILENAVELVDVWMERDNPCPKAMDDVDKDPPKQLGSADKVSLTTQGIELFSYTFILHEDVSAEQVIEELMKRVGVKGGGP
tara:strand:- start:354 stop:611 length:258 start_codon:yes stop_codon:yes gene_type:complete